MKTAFKILSFLMLLCLNLISYSQETTTQPKRTAEQEAARQTEKLQQELNLTTEQAKIVYEINLKYERERQISNTRTQAMERIKNKNADFQKVLTEDQFARLQHKRLERTTVDPNSVYRASENRVPTEYRTNQPVRVYSPDVNMRSAYRSGGSSSSGTPTNSGGSSAPQTVRRATSGSAPTTTQSRNSQTSPTPTTERPQSAPATSTPRKTETPTTSSGRR